jgi:hypothetical protein
MKAFSLPPLALSLYAVNSFLFLVLSFFFLPDGIVKCLAAQLVSRWEY